MACSCRSRFLGRASHDDARSLALSRTRAPTVDVNRTRYERIARVSPHRAERVTRRRGARVVGRCGELHAPDDRDRGRAVRGAGMVRIRDARDACSGVVMAWMMAWKCVSRGGAGLGARRARERGARCAVDRGRSRRGEKRVSRGCDCG